nr:putative reverse transcriptase domain-containing protein [Tanacetum cinerariifolium]
TAAVEKLVEKLGNADDKVECKKLKKELEEARLDDIGCNDVYHFMKQCNYESVDAAIAAEQARHVNVGNNAKGSGPVRGDVKLRRWFEKTESVFEINECTEGKKGLTDNIKGEVTSSKPANLNEAVCMAHKLMEHKSQARDKIILEGKKQKWESFQSGNSSGKSNHKDNLRQTLQNNQKQGNVRVMVTAPTDGKVSSRSLPLCERCFTRHVGLCTIKCHKCGKVRHKARYCKEKNVAMGANAQPIPTCFNLNLVNHIFEIDLMPIELGTFDIIIGIDWLVKHDAIVCGEKVVRLPYRNKTLIVKSNNGVSRLKVKSCIKARKYVERDCHLFFAHVMEKKSKVKRLEDMPVNRDFPKVFPEDFPRLPPLRQVEFQIDLGPGAAPVARAPYRSAPFEMRELSVQLQELLEKGFIHPRLSSWGAPVLFVKKKDGYF